MTLDLVTFFNAERFAESGSVQRVVCAPNERIIAQGQRDRFLYVLETGQVRVTARVDIEGDCCIQPGLVDLGPGAVFGEMNLFEAGTRSASVTALEECRLLRIDGAELAEFLENNTDLGYQLLQHFFLVLDERLRKADRRIERLLAWGLKAHGIEEHLADSGSAADRADDSVTE